MRAARSRHVRSPVVSAVLSRASTACMFAFTPRYPDTCDQSSEAESRNRPGPSSQNRVSSTSSASSSSAAAPGTSATVADAAEKTTNACA